MGIQVEEVTRNLMPWGKEYIDFSFAGRHISEFGLVAVTSGGRYQFAGSPEFEDETSNVNGVWGQYYWGTNFKIKTYEYSLATDGMTERQFEEFKHHFRPGHYGQFYEDAWFDRYCHVRVKNVINFNFIPFQEEVEIAGTKITSRIYKGECKLTLVQDRPFKYSFYQVLDLSLAESKKGQQEIKKTQELLRERKVYKKEIEQQILAVKIETKRISELISSMKNNMNIFSYGYAAEYSSKYPFLVYDTGRPATSRWAYLNINYNEKTERFYYEVLKVLGDNGESYDAIIGDSYLNTFSNTLKQCANDYISKTTTKFTQCTLATIDLQNKSFILELAPLTDYKAELIKQESQLIEKEAHLIELKQEIDKINYDILQLNNQFNNDNKKAAYRMMYHSNIPARDSWTKDVKCATGSWFSLPVIRKNTDIIKDENGNIIEVITEEQEESDNSMIYPLVSQIPYYNPSTISSETHITFTLNRTITTVNPKRWIPVYFNEIYDEFTNPKTPYNTISSTDKIYSSRGALNDIPRFIYKYKYGLPEISSDINKAINVAWNFYQENIRGALAELQNRLQEELVNGRVLMWAIKVLQKIQENQVFYRAEEQSQIESNRGWGILIDAQDNGNDNSSMDSIEKSSQEIIGEIVFHSGDYEHENYNNELDVQGCLRPNKIKIYATPILDTPFEVDWFGYFNVMMLLMFGRFTGPNCEDILYENTFDGFYPYTLKFDGEKGVAYNNYSVNYIYDNKILKEDKDILDENCSNIIASNYLKVEGGDTIDTSTGKIASYHILGFNHGEEESIMVRDVKLEYKYTYV